MKTTKLQKSARLVMSFVTLLGVTIFGFAGVGASASAATATITNTGPDSENEIVFANHVTCEVDNDTDIDFNNSVNQDARSGDATVSGNTVASGWGAWDPAVWQHKGYSYAEWSSAFEAYMANNHAEWESNWGNLSGGGATSGDASNVSSVNFDVSVENGGCDFGADVDNPGRQIPGSSHNPSALGASSTEGHEGKGGGFGAGGEQHGVFGPHGVLGASSGSSMGGSSGPGGVTPGGNGGSFSGGCIAGIDTTGPDSSNKIVCADTRQTEVSNTNNFNITNTTNQNATSGDATTGQNTGSGGGGTGGADNYDSSLLQLSAVN